MFRVKYLREQDTKPAFLRAWSLNISDEFIQINTQTPGGMVMLFKDELIYLKADGRLIWGDDPEECSDGNV